MDVEDRIQETLAPLGGVDTLVGADVELSPASSTSSSSTELAYSSSSSSSSSSPASPARDAARRRDKPDQVAAPTASPASSLQTVDESTPSRSSQTDMDAARSQRSARRAMSAMPMQGVPSVPEHHPFAAGDSGDEADDEHYSGSATPVTEADIAAHLETPSTGPGASASADSRGATPSSSPSASASASVASGAAPQRSADSPPYPERARTKSLPVSYSFPGAKPLPSSSVHSVSTARRAGGGYEALARVTHQEQRTRGASIAGYVSAGLAHGGLAGAGTQRRHHHLRRRSTAGLEGWARVRSFRDVGTFLGLVAVPKRESARAAQRAAVQRRWSRVRRAIRARTPSGTLELFKAAKHAPRPPASPWIVVTAAALIIAGGCGSAAVLELLNREDPGCAHLVTFCQFASSVVTSFSVDHFRRRRLSLVRHAEFVALNFAAQYLANLSLDWGVPLPVFFLVRNGNLLANMLVAAVLLKKRFTARQIGAVVVVTLGIVAATLFRPAKEVGATGGGATGTVEPAMLWASSNISLQSAASTAVEWLVWAAAQPFVIGVLMLVASLFAQAVCSARQELVFQEVGRCQAEVMFFQNALAMPLFVPQVPQFWVRGLSWVGRSSDMAFGTPFFALLAFNMVASFACKRAAFVMIGASSSLACAVTVNVYRTLALLISVLAFNAPPYPGLGMWLGMLLVFAGSAEYMVASSKAAAVAAAAATSSKALAAQKRDSAAQGVTTATVATASTPAGQRDSREVPPTDISAGRRRGSGGRASSFRAAGAGQLRRRKSGHAGK